MNQESKIINYHKNYDKSVWSIDCLYCKLHNPDKEIDTWYDCDECCNQYTNQPPEYILKQRFKMKLIRNVLVPQPAPQPCVNVITEPEQVVEIDPIEPFFYIKGISQLNEFMKSGRKYLEKNIGIQFQKDFCKSIMKSEYQKQDIGMEDLIFKIDFSKSIPTTKRGMIFLNILLSGEYSLDQMIGLSLTNNLDKLNE